MRAKSTALIPGKPAVITGGSSAGQRVEVVQEAKLRWKLDDGTDVPMWCVKYGSPPRLAVIRGDFLRPAEVAS